MSIEIKSDILAKELNQGIVPLGVPKAYQYDAALVEAARAAVNQGIDDVAEAGDTAKAAVEAQGTASVNAVSAQEQASKADVNALGDKILAQMKHGYGYPFTAATAAAMTDTAKIYVYTGAETGYINGNWYYWNGTAWTSGGVYNATALETDTTLTISGAAADAKVVGDDYNYQFPMGKNLFTTQNASLDKICAYDSGVIKDTPGWVLTDFIPVNANTQYTFSGAVAHVCFFNSAKNYISGIVSTEPSVSPYTPVMPFTTPNNCAYIRFSIQPDRQNFAQLELGDSRTEYEPYRPYRFLENNRIGCSKPFFLTPTLSVKKIADGYNLKTTGNIYFFDCVGGYYVIKPFDIDLPHNKAMLLSKDGETDTPINPTIRGDGEELFFTLENRTAFNENSFVFAMCWSNMIYSYDRIVETLLENNRIGCSKPFFLTPTLSVKKIADGYNLKTTGNIYFFDCVGGYYVIKPFDIDLPHNKAMLLSKDGETDTPINPTIRGDGEELFFTLENRTAFNENSFVFAMCWSDMIYSYDGIIEKILLKNDNNNINSIVPSEPQNESPLINTLDIFSKLKDKTKDVTILQIGDSISTNNLYASAADDAPYAPPRMDDKCLPYFVEKLYRWRGQQYRRSDAMIDESSNVAMFTESASSAETKYYDAAWDWQFSNQESNYYKLWTRVLSGTNCSVSFTIPAGIKNFAFIYRTDYLCADSCVVNTNAQDGVVTARHFDESTPVEANGFTFSMKEQNVINQYTVNLSDGTTQSRIYRISKGQHRIVFHVHDPSNAITVTFTNVGSGRLNYWGVEYTPYDSMFRFINVARGGHNISALQCFESYDVDYFKPDAILLQCPIINEGAMSVVPSSTPNTPTAFAQRISDYITHLRNKDYEPNVIPYVLYIGVQANIVNQTTGAYMCSSINQVGYVDTYRYIGALDKYAKLANDNIFLNFFLTIDNIAHKLADMNDGNVYTSAIQGSGATGHTLTCDNVHPNDFATKIYYHLIKYWLNI